MNKPSPLLLIALPGLLAAGNGFAAAAIDLHGGTLGLGAGLTVGLTDQLNVRGTFNTFSYGYDDEVSDIDYDLDLDLGSAGLLLDWHPGGGGFRISAGAYYNDNGVDGTGEPSAPLVEIGDAVFPTSEVGTLEADVEFDELAPYVGIGWGNPITRDGRLGISFDVGVLFQGEPRVDFRSVGANPLLRDRIDEEIAAEEAEIRDDVDDYELYPVVAVGVSYRF